MNNFYRIFKQNHLKAIKYTQINKNFKIYNDMQNTILDIDSLLSRIGLCYFTLLFI